MSIHTHEHDTHIHVTTCGPIQEIDIKWHGSSLPLYVINKLTNHQESLRWIQMFPKNVNSINMMA